ncbi:MAG: hypothetical protein R6V47_03760 [Candidatus Delongbacteria bacterium]
MKNIILIIFFMFFALNAQISVFTNKTELYTGERLKITAEVVYPEGSSPDLGRIKNSGDDDFVQVKSETVSRNVSDGSVKETIVNEYAVFAKEGEVYFKPLEFGYVTGEDAFEFKSDSLRINVRSISKETKVTVTDSLGNERRVRLDSLGMVLPVKDIATYKMSVREKWYIAIFLLLLILFIIAIWLILRRKKRKNLPAEVAEEKKIPAHIIAIENLNRLKQKKLLEKGEFKDFAAELSLIFRNFLEDRFDFPGAELPTEELKSEIRERVTDAETLENADKLLEVTDFVKYAKFIPLEAELKSFLDFAYHAVDKLKEETDGKKK